MSRIYLDYNASTPLDPQVLNVLIHTLEEEKGNPSSIHFDGQKAKRKLEHSRQIIANFFKVKPQEVIFTSGGTEGATLLLHGFKKQFPTGHVISSGSEHSCVYQFLKEWEEKGAKVSYLSTGSYGAVLPKDVENAIQPDTCLITLMGANNETGVMSDLNAISEIAQKANIPFIVDGVALLGKEKFLIHSGISALFFSGHKIYAPKGVGFCICRSHFKLSPLFSGGGQEFNRRGGTENLPGIVALAQAITLLEKDEEKTINHMSYLRDHFERELLNHLSDVVVNGSGPRVSNTSNISFLGVDGESLLMNLDIEGVSVSHGSACSSGGLEPSRVLLSMGLSIPQARSAIRFSFGKMTTLEEIQRTLAIIIPLVKKLRKK